MTTASNDPTVSAGEGEEGEREEEEVPVPGADDSPLIEGPFLLRIVHERVKLVQNNEEQKHESKQMDTELHNESNTEVPSRESFKEVTARSLKTAEKQTPTPVVAVAVLGGALAPAAIPSAPAEEAASSIILAAGVSQTPGAFAVVPSWVRQPLDSAAENPLLDPLDGTQQQQQDQQQQDQQQEDQPVAISIDESAYIKQIRRLILEEATEATDVHIVLNSSDSHKEDEAQQQKRFILLLGNCVLLLTIIASIVAVVVFLSNSSISSTQIGDGNHATNSNSSKSSNHNSTTGESTSTVDWPFSESPTWMEVQQRGYLKCGFMAENGVDIQNTIDWFVVSIFFLVVCFFHVEPSC